MIKKIMMIIAVMSFALCQFAFGADVDVQPEQNAKITVWETQGPEGDFILSAAKAFQAKYPKANIKIQLVPQEADKSVAKMQTAVQAGRGAADVFVFMSDQLGNAIDGGLLLPNMVSADIIKKDFMPAAVSASTGPDGKIYGFPLAIQTYAMYYNKKFFPNGVQTFEQLLDFAKTFNNGNSNKYALMFDASNFYYAGAFLQMYGGQVFGMKGNSYNQNDLEINSVNSIKGIQALVNLRPAMQRQTGKDSAAAMMGLFGDGKVATIIDGPWDVKRAQGTGVDFGICSIPTYQGKHPISFSGIRLMGVNPNSSYPKAAELFAKFCTSPDMLKQRFTTVGEIPPITALADDPVITKSQYASAFATQAKYSAPMPNIPAMAAVWDPMQAGIADAYNGKTTVKKALDNAYKVIQQQINMTYNSSK